MKRREFVKNSAFMLSNLGLINTVFSNEFPEVRTKKENRKFSDSIIEDTIIRLKIKLKDQEIVWLFGELILKLEKERPHLLTLNF